MGFRSTELEAQAMEAERAIDLDASSKLCHGGHELRLRERENILECNRDTVDKRCFKSHEIIVQSVGLVHAKVPLPPQSGIVFPLIGVSLPPIVIWKTRCFARVDANGTLYRSFARASIHVDVTILAPGSACGLLTQLIDMSYLVLQQRAGDVYCEGGMVCILENGALQKNAYLCIDVHVDDMT
nr:hypothetical protein CFP56_60980 [Quercus suber]